jgi:hypothetical protein
LSNTKQLGLGWVMAVQDRSGDLLDAEVSALTWLDRNNSYMTWGPEASNTNTDTLRTNVIVQSVALFKCPADRFKSPQNPGERARSYAMNGVFGGKPNVQGTDPGNGTGSRNYYGAPGAVQGAGLIKSESQLIAPGPSRTWLFIDEHPDSIDDGCFMFDPGYSPAAAIWRNLPASSHGGNPGDRSAITFADGHSEMHKWKDGSTRIAVSYSYFTASTKPSAKPGNDYKDMEDMMPYR